MKTCILFAGVVGCSKTPVAHYLSCNLNLPIFNNDAIRSEVTEDFGSFNESEYIKRRDERLKSIVKNGQSFICDASMDRIFKDVKDILEKHGYQWKLISFDLSQKFLQNLLISKGYTETLTRLDQLIKDHDEFLDNYESDVSLHITDSYFADRLSLSLEACLSINS